MSGPSPIDVFQQSNAILDEALLHCQGMPIRRVKRINALPEVTWIPIDMPPTSRWQRFRWRVRDAWLVLCGKTEVE